MTNLDETKRLIHHARVLASRDHLLTTSSIQTGEAHSIEQNACEWSATKLTEIDDMRQECNYEKE